MFSKTNAIVPLTILMLILGKNAAAQSYFFERVYDESLAQASYVIGDFNTQEAIVIDAQRDIDIYLEIAKENNLKITKITETHIHADFLSGSRELALATNAELLLSDEGGADWQYEFPHTGLKDGSIIHIGQVTLEVMHTPGHTPESITFLVSDNKMPMTPKRAITGDFIFVGDVGRPDLLEKSAGQIGSQEIGAKQLYASIQRFSKLADDTEIWPGHGAGSFCGKSLSNIPQSTLKDEKQNNPAFHFAHDVEDFIRYILDGQPTPPKYFAKMKSLNKIDRPLLVQVPIHPNLTQNDLQQAIDNNLLIIDTRKKEQVAKGYIPNSLHIENGNSLSTWVGSLTDYQRQIVLITTKNQTEELTRKLMRIGMDNIYGFVTELDKMTIPLEKYNLISRQDLKKNLGNKAIQIIDVRTENEYKNGHIKGAENIVLTALEDNLDKINTEKTVVIHCQSGVRAAMAYSLLKKYGFENILNYSGGINEWNENNEELVR